MEFNDLMDFSLFSNENSIFHNNPTKSKTNNNKTNNASLINEYINDLVVEEEDYSLPDFNTNNNKPKLKSNANSDSNLIELDVVKHKISSLWNNVKYGWSNYIKKPSKIDLDSKTNEPVFILGKKFYTNANQSSPHSDQTSIDLKNKIGQSTFYFNDSDLNDFYTDNNQFISINSTEQELSSSYATYDLDEPNSSLINKHMKTPLEQEVYSRLWFTYRKDFQPLDGNSKYTSDCGWGCMLRSAQMLIAQAFLIHYFGYDWSLYKSLRTEQDVNLYKQIIGLFNDRTSPECPFGLHKLLEIADRKSEQTSRVGTWFGPTSACMLMRDSLNESNINLLKSIRIYMAQDCTIFKQDVLNMCLKEDNFMPCIILISARLGGDNINEIYVDTLKIYLEMKNCIGIIGGKPKHSLYLIGYQSDKCIVLDPHFCQPQINIGDNQVFFDNKSFHCSNAGKILFSKLDPSLAIGFYIRDLDEFNNFCDLVKRNQKSEYFCPFFGINEDSFEKTLLNYELFSLEDKIVSPPAIKKNPKNNQRCFSKLLKSNNLNSKPNFSKSTSLTNLNKPKKPSDDDFVLI